MPSYNCIFFVCRIVLPQLYFSCDSWKRKTLEVFLIIKKKILSLTFVLKDEGLLMISVHVDAGKITLTGNASALRSSKH